MANSTELLVHSEINTYTTKENLLVHETRHHELSHTHPLVQTYSWLVQHCSYTVGLAFGLGRVRSSVRSLLSILFIVYGFTPFISPGGHLEHKLEGVESPTCQPRRTNIASIRVWEAPNIKNRNEFQWFLNLRSIQQIYFRRQMTRICIPENMATTHVNSRYEAWLR